MQACSDGSCERVRLLIGKKKANLEHRGNFVDEEGRESVGTPLISAICRDHPEVVELLIDYGANLDYRFNVF